jgi:hemolysin activation/secretion protein
MMFRNKTSVGKNFLGALLFVSVSLVTISSASAQLEQQTGIADPGRAEERLTDERLVPQVGPKITVKEVALIEAPAGAENINFNFGGVVFDGLSVYDYDQIAPIFEDMIGTEISLADAYAVANRVTLKYRNDGYVLTQVVVPPQTIDNGIIQLQVVEGYIDNIIIQGGELTKTELKLVQDYASQIAQGGALNVTELERNLLLVNDLPGLSARSVISPSPTTPGAADITIIPERDIYEAIVGINNHGSRFLGPVQLTGVGIVNSAFGLNERITAQLVAAPDAGMELAFGSLTYDQPIGRYGTILTVSGSATETDPGYTLSQFDVEGKSRSFTVQAKHPILRSRNTNISARALFDYRNVESRNNIETTRKDYIRAVRAGLQADFLDRIFGVAVNSLDLQISQGVKVMNASEEGDANMTRAAGDPQFTKANLRVQRLQRLTDRFNLVLEGRAQLSNNPLLSSEEFGLGGINTVRGYDPSEVVGDDGIAGKAELQWNSENRDLQLFGFLDSGTVWNQDATSSATERDSLTSTGGGVRLDMTMDINAEALVAFPLHRDVQTRGDRDPQFFFSFSKTF